MKSKKGKGSNVTKNYNKPAKNRNREVHLQATESTIRAPLKYFAVLTSERIPEI